MFVSLLYVEGFHLLTFKDTNTKVANYRAKCFVMLSVTVKKSPRAPAIHLWAGAHMCKGLGDVSKTLTACCAAFRWIKWTEVEVEGLMLPHLYWWLLLPPPWVDLQWHCKQQNNEQNTFVFICAGNIWSMICSTKQNKEYHWPFCMYEGSSIFSALTCFFLCWKTVRLTHSLCDECLKSSIFYCVKMNWTERIKRRRASH